MNLTRFLSGRTSLPVLALAVAVVLVPITNAGAAEVVPSGQQQTQAVTAGGFIATPSNEPDAPEQPPYYARTNYNWPFASGPYYGDVEDGTQPGTVVTPVGSFNLLQGVSLPEGLRSSNRLGELTVQHFILQLDPGVFAADGFQAIEHAINANGGAILRAIPTASFVVRLTGGAQSALQGLPGVINIEPYHAAFKLHPMIGRAPLPDSAAAISDIYALSVQLHHGMDSQSVAQQLAALGATVKHISGSSIRIDASRTLLPSIAGIEAVSIVFEDLPTHGQSEETTTTLQTGRWNSGATPYHDAGVTGSGEILAVIDNGFSIDAGDLSETDSSAGTPGVSHRKVIVLKDATGYGGSGDTLSCDDPLNGGRTHGHTVAATALGNATNVDGAYGSPYFANDRADGTGRNWALDGVALKAKLVAIDAFTTPLVGCDRNQIDAGDLYNPANPADTAAGLSDVYVTYGADTVNLSFGAKSNTYDEDPTDVDEFLDDRRDAMVFIAAGNDGTDVDNINGKDTGTLRNIANSKNGLVIGSTGNANDISTGGDEEDISFFSSMGPRTVDQTTDRNAHADRPFTPVLMAPGQERGGMGLASEFTCRSNDNANVNGSAAICDVTTGRAGTTYAAPAAAGAGLLVRHYFAAGFHPDGTDQNPLNANDLVGTISGALLKAVLISSADWVGVGNALPANGTEDYRGNQEQGYGRIQLNNALPLANYPSSNGLMVVDGDTVSGVNDFSGQGVTGSLTGGGDSETMTFEVCDDSSELRVALAWTEGAGAALVNDIDLIVASPGSTNTYLGNYFTDDINRNGVQDASEDCPTFDGTPNTRDATPWSLPSCGNAAVHSTGSCTTGNASGGDCKNTYEAVFLSTDPNDDGDQTDSQIETGTWTITVQGRGGWAGPQAYGLAVTGAVCNRSNVQFSIPDDDGFLQDVSEFSCNARPILTVTESNDALDASVDATEVGTRTEIQVINPGPDGVLGGGDDSTVDTETGVSFTQNGTALSFSSSALVIYGNPSPNNGNGAVEVQDGYFVRAIYKDEQSGSPVTNLQREVTVRVDCRVDLDVSGFVFGTFGVNQQVLISGGCERNLRSTPIFDFGFPDRYMDEGERVGVNFLFTMIEQQDLEDATASLSCVLVDADSPATCAPGTPASECDCPTAPNCDPDRTNNTPCSELTVLDSPKNLGRIPGNSVIAANFTVQMADSIPGACPGAGCPTVELLLGIESPVAGKTAQGQAVARTRLNVDASEELFSTDFIGGAVSPELIDWNNNEVIEDPTRNLGDFNLDYRFETWDWDDATKNGTDGAPQNTGLITPFDFDAGRNGFTNGWTGNSSDVGLDKIANWGEDRNYDGALQAEEDIDESNGVLDYAHSLTGGCGWQSSNGADRGVWHTGLIKDPSVATICQDDTGSYECQFIDRLTGTENEKVVFEVLRTPVIEKVNTGLDANGDPTHAVEILTFSWNALLDIPDSYSGMSWEFDTDAATQEPVSLTADSSFLRAFAGPYGPRSLGSNPGLTNGYPIFQQLDSDYEGGPGDPQGTRTGSNSCAITSGNTGVVSQQPFLWGMSLPDDDDINNDGDGATDENVTEVGPLRNFDLTHFNGPDMRFTILEDLYGTTGDTFQGGIGFFVVEGTASESPESGFGLAVDDVVVEWQEITLGDDATDCASGACATLELDTFQSFAGNARIGVRVYDAFPYDPTNNVNNCNDDFNCATAFTNVCSGDSESVGCTSVGNECATQNCSGDRSKSCTSGADCSVSTCNGDTSVTCNTGADCASGGVSCSLVLGECVGPGNPTGNGVACDSDDDCQVCATDIVCDGGRCSSNSQKVCSTNADCHVCEAPETCGGGGFCNDNPNQACASDADCRNCVEINTVCKGDPTTNCTGSNDCSGATCDSGFCSGNLSLACTTNADCQVCESPPCRADSDCDLGGGRCDQNATVKCTTDADCEADPTADGTCLLFPDTTCADDDDCTVGFCSNDPSTKCTTQAGLECIFSTSDIGSCIKLCVWDCQEQCEPDFGDAEDTNDCDGDGTMDILVRATSSSEPAGELIVLNQNTTNSNLWEGEIPISAVFDSEGTLLTQRQGAIAPSVTAVYVDRDVDGSGLVCENSIDPEAQGRITTFTPVFFPAGAVSIVSTRMTDNGDNDGVADEGETVNLYLKVQNGTGADINGLVARVTTNSPLVDCILQPLSVIGDVPKDGTAEAPEDPDPTMDQAIVFRVSDLASRSSEFEDLFATLNITMAAEQFDSLAAPTSVDLDLDLNITGGATPQSFSEPFDGTGGDLASFTTMSLDLNKATNAGSDGFRCQYNDPDWIGSNSYNEAKCYLGYAGGATNPFDWHIHDGTAPDGGRGYNDGVSLHLGKEDPGNNADLLTTSTSQMDAVRSEDPINLGYSGFGGGGVQGIPELSFKHQVSLMDSRTVNTPPGFAADRGVVHVQLADAGGAASGDWIKVYPYQNVYDVQGAQNYVNCTFDPIDDGNTEDDFFDPSDPNRRTGPNSMCFPEFQFGFLGATDHRQAFQELNLGSADGPALRGNTGNGTWVESKFNLGRLQGRRVRLRFIFTSIELDDEQKDYEEAFEFNPDPRDDGWFIDDIQISNTLATAATVSVDNGTPPVANDCGNAACTTVTADLKVDGASTPADSAAPGEARELDASGSSANQCTDGTLQFQFWEDTNDNSVIGDTGDKLLRNYTDNPVLVVAPTATTRYGTVVRCSSLTSCNDDAAQLITVNVPGAGGGTPGEASRPGLNQMEVTAYNKGTGEISISYDPACNSSDHTIVWGDLANVSTYGWSDQECLVGTSGSANFTPAQASAFYVIVANDTTVEGSYGEDSTGTERPEASGLAGCDYAQDLTNSCDP